MPDYIFDTTVLSNFALAGRTDLLERRYTGVAFTTVEVANELRRGVKAGYAYIESILRHIESFDPDGWLRVLVPESAAEHRARAEFDEVLGPGEASCLVLAISRGMTFATDDLAARRLAQAQEVPLTGTCGILVALVLSDALTLAEANSRLAAMIQRGYRSPIDSLDELV
jgi:predicted nucleic acid-binding protein